MLSFRKDMGKEGSQPGPLQRPPSIVDAGIQGAPRTAFLQGNRETCGVGSMQGKDRLLPSPFLTSKPGATIGQAREASRETHVRLGRRLYPPSTHPPPPPPPLTVVKPRGGIGADWKLLGRTAPFSLHVPLPLVGEGKRCLQHLGTAWDAAGRGHWIRCTHQCPGNVGELKARS